MAAHKTTAENPSFDLKWKTKYRRGSGAQRELSPAQPDSEYEAYRDNNMWIMRTRLTTFLHKERSINSE